MAKARQRGFTLMELMITVAIVGILAAVAYPAYTSHIIKSNRTAAKAQMMDIANREQQYLLANRSYAEKTTATDPAFTTLSYTMPTELQTRYEYVVATTSTPAPAYTIMFTAKGPQLSDGPLTLTSSGVKSPSSKW